MIFPKFCLNSFSMFIIPQFDISQLGKTCRRKLNCPYEVLPFQKPRSSLSVSRDKIASNQVCQIIMDRQIPDDEIGRTEISGAGESTSRQVDMNQEPYEGMLFQSEEAAKAFYDDYAKRVGFSTRVLSSRKSERDGSIISRGLACRGGLRNRRREGCMAMILVKREMPGRWVVRKFVKDHNHQLVVRLQKSRPTPDEKDKKIQELTAELRVKKRLSASYREQLLKVMKDVEDHNENLSTKVQVVRNKLKELEAKRWEVLHHA